MSVLAYLPVADSTFRFRHDTACTVLSHLGYLEWFEDVFVTGITHASVHRVEPQRRSHV